MNEWNIQSRSHHCQVCEQAFADRQPYHTVLFDEKKGYLRQDVCEPCWSARDAAQAAQRDGFISQWQGVYETPPSAAPEAIQKDTAETLLRKLVERNDPTHAAACYILAAMLERKRLLKVKEQVVRDGARTFIYEHPKSGDVFTIADPNLQLNQLDAVQRDVAQLLEHGLPEPAPALGAETPVPESAEPAASAAPPAEAEPAAESVAAR